MKTLLLASLLFCGTASAASPSSINNDDSCDIKVGPAATLLLPYFEVDPNPTVQGQTTLFTITNVTRYPQVAHVTLWTDWAYPVLTFNVFLTGYDVQAINLYDVIVRGSVAPPRGTTSATTPGALSAAGGNLRTTRDCANNPAFLPASLTAAVRIALSIGIFNPGGGVTACNTAGGVHQHAIGYATIDVVANCTNRLPSDPDYFSNDLLFDNVLIGDYQQIGANPAHTSSSAFDAAGNPMVHIRAVPEGGGAGSNVLTALPYTFYDRYTPSATRTIDRRQPLPSTFAVRFIEGGSSGFATNLTIWREGLNGVGASCQSFNSNESMGLGEVVRFDEHENAFSAQRSTASPICCAPTILPATSAKSSADTYPQFGGPDVGGWLYLNLNNSGSAAYSVTQRAGGVPVPTNARTSLAPVGSTTTAGPRPSQNWVTVTMFGNVAGNHLTAEFDATPLGNGCTPATFRATADPYSNSGHFDSVPIGPAGGVFVCPPGTTLTNGTTALCAGTNVNPIP